MTGRVLTPQQVLDRIPHREPFRFIDQILEIDEDHVVSAVCFSPELEFYRGHFPGKPITPGVILVEAMAQAGVVALGIYLLALDGSEDENGKMLTLFTDAQVDFSGVVNPADRVTVHASKVFFRRHKLRSHVEMRLEDGSVVCSGVLSGMGVPR